VTAPIAVLLVDGSAFMRSALKRIVETDPALAVAGTAASAGEALALTRVTGPRIAVVDLADGGEAVRALVGEHGARLAVIALGDGPDTAAAIIAALDAGAVDFVAKSSAAHRIDIGRLDQELRAKIKQWADQPIDAAERAAVAPAATARPARAPVPGRPVDLIAVGVSTGGPQAVVGLLRALGRIEPPVVVAQHMPATFTRGFAESLAHDTGLRVVEGGPGGRLEPASVTILAGGRDAAVARRRPDGALELRATDAVGTIHPSVDRLFETAATAAASAIGVVLTGMGSDGVRGAAAFAAVGFPVLVQAPATAVVGGMPLAVIEAGLASEVLAIPHIGARIAEWAAARGRQ
jgi:two-component system, chemotaxis family, protein-glutamate methylesterase/glutaminase